MTDTAAQLAAGTADGVSLADSSHNRMMDPESQSPSSKTQQSSTTGRSPKKRRKVTHGMYRDDDNPGLASCPHLSRGRAYN